MKRIVSYRLSIVLLVQVLVSACSYRVELGPEAYMQWYSDNAELLQVSKQVGDLEYHYAYKPLELLVAKQWMGATTPEQKAELKALLQNPNAEELNFTFKIKNLADNQDLLKKGVRHIGEYNDRVRYYSFEAHRNFTLQSPTDTLYCAGAHFERTYGLAPHITLNLVFNPQESVNDLFSGRHDITLVYDDRVFNNGRIKLVLPRKHLRKIPKLKL